MESNEVFDELLQFLQPGTRLDLKRISLDNLLGMSGTPNGIQTLLKNEQIVLILIELTGDSDFLVSKTALFTVVNISADDNGASELLKYKPFGTTNVIELFLGYVMDPKKPFADPACMILSNITRNESSLEVCLDTFFPHLVELLKILVNISYNEKLCHLNYLAPLFSNLSCSTRVRKWMTEPVLEEYPFIPLKMILPFCNYSKSVIRRGGAIGIVRNLSFDTSYHEILLSDKLDLLTYILPPIMGNEDYVEDEMEKLPVAVQYYSKDKVRDRDIDIRRMVIETLNKLCAKTHGRETLRDNGVYYVLREYFKWETDPSVLLACENVIDILIQKEDEVGAEDLSSIEVPQDMVDKFNTMDKEYLKNVQ